jgi:hypothetical protein
MEKAPYKLHELIGDPIENFHLLGKQDKKFFKKSRPHLESLLSTPWKLTDQIIQASIKKLVKSIPQKAGPLDPWLKSYAEGLHIPLEDLKFTLLVPELVSSLTKWFPKTPLPISMVGCSSFLYAEETSKMLRLLDFPLGTSYTAGERAVLYQFPSAPKIFSLSTAGLPYAGLTSMTSNGINFSLHQKFSNIFEARGLPVFDYVMMLLLECETKNDVLKFIKKHPTKTLWGMHFTFPGNEALVVDVAYKNSTHEEFTLKTPRSKIFYFNNVPMGLSIEQFRENPQVPLGIPGYCEDREFSAQNKIKEFKSLIKKPKHEAQLLQEICSYQTLDPNTPWKMDCLTPSTLSASLFDAENGRAWAILGAAPKYYTGSIQYFTKLWDSPQDQILTSDLKEKNVKNSRAQNSLGHYMEAQKYYDLKDWHLSFHHLQMSIAHSRDLSERVIAQFFLLVFRYIHDRQKPIRHALAQEFLEILPLLPVYLADHARLFILRLYTEIGEKCPIKMRDIQHPKLKKLHQKERKYAVVFFRFVLPHLCFPRLDITDIIYLHA